MLLLTKEDEELINFFDDYINEQIDKAWSLKSVIDKSNLSEELQKISREVLHEVIDNISNLKMWAFVFAYQSYNRYRYSKGVRV